MDHPPLKDYLQKNTIPAKSGRRCVDGRYQPNTDSSGMIARPGGDLGYAEILLAIDEGKNLGLSPEECFDKIFEALHSLDEKFYLHTDEHSDPKNIQLTTHNVEPKIGCGHAAKPMNPDLCHDYHLNSEEEQKLVVYARKRASENPKDVIMVSLPGDHKEKAVLVNTGMSKTLNSSDGEHMFFLYDKARDEEFMKQLVETLNMPEVSFEKFQKMSEIQTNSTLHNLAKGLEIIEVNADEANPTPKKVGTVK